MGAKFSEKGSEVQAEINKREDEEDMAGRSSAMPVCVRTLDGNAVEVQIGPGDSVSRIKRAIARQNGIDPRQQKLMLLDMELDASRFTRDYSISEKTELQLIVVEPPHRFSSRKKGQIKVSQDGKLRP